MAFSLGSSFRRHSQRLRRSRALENIAVEVLVGLVKILRALPSRWVLWSADRLGTLSTLYDRRGRKAALQNLRIAFGDTYSERERRRIFKSSQQLVMRSMALLLHLQPLTAKKYLRWVDMPDVRDHEKTRHIIDKGAVLVSGHVGNWELLLGMRILFPGFPPTVFLAEEIPYGAINRFLQKLRAHGDLISAFRKGGARTVIKVVADGGIAGLLVDRNVRRPHGGVFAPFLGLPARTTPLPAWIALRHGVPVYPIFCLPKGDGRYRMWMGPDLSKDLPGEDDRERTVALLTRINQTLETLIRAQPELWTWSLKRFKSRPEVELGDYPPYSIHDPD